MRGDKYAEERLPVLSDEELERVMANLGHCRAGIEAALKNCEDATVGQRSESDFEHIVALASVQDYKLRRLGLCATKLGSSSRR